MRRILLLTVMCIALLGSAMAQHSVSGTVVSGSDGLSMPGVTVSEKGTTQGTITNTDGKYTLKVTSGKSILVFSFVGMKTIEQPLNDRSLVNIKMVSTEIGLDEVVVTALGLSRQKKALGYSQESVKGAELAESAAPNIVNAMSGKMAGVNITSPNGVEGGTTRIVIGGNNSIQGDNQPLIIVDGMPMANDISGSAADVTSPQDWGNAINLINPVDIDDVSVLKGPAAAALYGGRGANGVILIQ